MKKMLYALLLAGGLLFSLNGIAQEPGMYQVPLDQKIENSSVIIEGTVLSQTGFWNTDRTHIYTSNIVKVHRVLKGNLHSAEIEIITEGGEVGYNMESLSATLSLAVGQTGVFFCNIHNIEGSPSGISKSYMVYGSRQGFIRYVVNENRAVVPFATYPNIYDAINTIKAETGKDETISTNEALEAAKQHTANKTTAIPTISLFSPTTITAGTGSVLTIMGTNFGSSQSTGYVEFKNGDDGGATWVQPLASDYVSWSNTQIQVKVPSYSNGGGGPAGTGTIRVTNSDPNTTTSSGTLTVSFAYSNAASGGVSYRPFLYNQNGNGGYTLQMNTTFASNTAAAAAFTRSMNNWTCATNMNWTLGSTTAVSAANNDGVNVVSFDNINALPVGILGRTTTYFNGSNCGGSIIVVADGMDLIFSTTLPAGTSWQYGPTLATGSEIDFESVTLHELGHAHQLTHIIDAGAVMHYAASSGQNSRTLSASSDIAGGQYIMSVSTPVNACNSLWTPMTPLPCPYYFRSAASGNWNSNSTWESSNDNNYWISSALTPEGTNANAITIQNGHTVTATQDITVDQLTVNSGGSLAIDAGVALTVNDGTGTDIIVSSGGSMTLKSSASGDAWIASTAGTISGNVTVERYIPASGKRAWRLLAVPLSTTGAPTIYDSWQESGSSTAGYGTVITNAGGAAVAGSWDAGVSGSTASSLRQYVSATNTLTTPTATSADITDEPAWFLFVRGDRTVTATAGGTASSNTTLRMTGNLKMGNQDFTVPATNWALIGNPYASPIDFSLSVANANTTHTLNKVWVWDPKLGSVGGYVLLDGTLPTPYTPSVTGGSYSTPTSIIQSGQGFLVKSDGTAGNLRIDENDKASTWQNVFKTTNGTDPFLAVRLNMSAGASGFSPADGVIAVFGNSYSAAVTDEDGLKMDNFGPNLALVNNNTNLTIEKRPDISLTDTLPLNIWNTAAGSYQLQFQGTNFAGSSTIAYLIDNFQNTVTPLSLTTNTTYPFTITSAAASYGANRFKIVFQNTTPLSNNVIAISAAKNQDGVLVSWSMENEETVRNYEVERSDDGRAFAAIGTVSNFAAGAYRFLDVSPLESNYYRIKATLKDNTSLYSHIVHITDGNKTPAVSVTPNPITGTTINLQLTDLDAGNYKLEVYNIAGQLTYSTEFIHSGGSAIKILDTGNAIKAKGIYTLKISKGNTVFTQKLLWQ
jgi:hypothetical protein